MIKSFEYIRDKIEKDVESYKKKFKAEFFNEDYEKLSENEQIAVNEKYSSILRKLNSDINVPNKSYSKLMSFFVK